MKRGQLKISFGMIFSIVLIIVFLAFAFYAVKKLIEFQDNIKVNQFGDDLQKDIDNLWRSSQGDYDREYRVPNKVVSVCIVDDDYENLIFTAEEYIQGKNIKNVDIEKTLENKDSLCFNNVNGKVIINFKKDYGDALVTLSQ